MDADVHHAVERAAADDAVRAIVITGAGRGFCAGADMSRLSRLSAGETPRAIIGANGSKPGNFEQKFSYLLAVPKPIFAAINGPVAGIAFCLILFCDFRYMAEGAKLTTAFAKRGLIAEHGSAWMLPRLIGPMNALDLLYSARMVNTAEAERLGLVRRLPADNFRADVKAIARELVTAVIAPLDRRHQTASFPVVFPVARGSLGGRRQGDDRIVWLGRFQGRGGAFRREAHRDVFRSMRCGT
jgi:enoyl-CoA hydratase/carnithine racemase